MQQPTVTRATGADSAAGTGSRILFCLFAALLLVIGAGLGFAGARAITEEHWEMAWRSGGALTMGPIALQQQRQSGVSVYHGIDGIRAGVGLVSAGVMLTLWAVGVA